MQTLHRGGPQSGQWTVDALILRLLQCELIILSIALTNDARWGRSRREDNKKYSNFKFFMIFSQIQINQSLTAWALANLLIRMSRAIPPLSLSLSRLICINCDCIKYHELRWGILRIHHTHTHTHGRGLTVSVCVCVCLLLSPFFCACCPGLPASLCGTTNKATYTWLKSTVC